MIYSQCLVIVMSRSHTLHLNTYKLSQDHLTERNPVQEDHDYCDPPNISVISEFKKASIS